MPAPQNQQMSRNKSVRHLGLYGYVWEWDGEDAQGNKWRRFDPKLRECSTRATTLDLKLDLKLDLVVLPQNQTGKEVLNMGNYDVNLHLMNLQTKKATGSQAKRASARRACGTNACSASCGASSRPRQT